MKGGSKVSLPENASPSFVSLQIEKMCLPLFFSAVLALFGPAELKQDSFAFH